MTITNCDRSASIDIYPLIALPDRVVGVGALIMPATSGTSCATEIGE